MRVMLAAVLCAACGGTPAAAPPTLPPPAPEAPAPQAPAPQAAAMPALVEPDVLGEEARARDKAREPLAAAAVDAYSNWNGLFSSLVASWSPDGKRIVFGSTRSGVPEIYSADPARPAAEPIAITRGPERAIWAGFTRDGKSILYLRDHGANEQHAIWRVGLDGTGETNLTVDGDMHRDEPILPRGVPGLALYSASETSSPSAHLYSLDLGGGAPKKIYSQPLPGGAIDGTDDGKRVLFVEYHADDDLVTREVDVATGQARQIYPAEGKKAPLYYSAYSSDEKLVLVATDDEGGAVLVAVDPATGKEVARYRDKVTTGGLTFAAAPKGGLVAVGIDAGNHGEIRILDEKTLKLRRTVAVPLGDVKLGAWRPDGRAFSILISLPDQPADVFAVDAASGKVTPLRKDARPGLGDLPVITASIVEIKAFDGLTIPVNVYLPKGGGPRRPTLAIFHGGPSSSYAVRWNAWNRFFTALGYAVVEPNVRGSSGFGRAYEMADNREKRADWLKDVEAVNAWVKAQPWCDPERVVVMGGSYGGYTVLMALTRQPTLWRAGVDIFGVADLKAFLKTTDAAIRTGFAGEFGDLDKDPALLEEFSPMRDVDKIVRPLFVYAGQNDPRVPRSESDAIVRALRERKVPVEYMVAANEGHSIDRRENKIEMCVRVARFLEDALR